MHETRLTGEVQDRYRGTDRNQYHSDSSLDWSHLALTYLYCTAKAGLPVAIYTYNGMVSSLPCCQHNMKYSG